MLQIYNTLSKQKEIFKPMHSGKVDLYVCGVTIYDYCHIGHARVYLVFDVIIRYLNYLNFKVNYIRNITDVDDKIIKRAKERNIPIETLTAEFIRGMWEDFKALNILEPSLEPRATEYIDSMINLIQQLIAKDYAYVGESGDVYFNVQKFATYGCLSHRDLEELQAGARIEVNEAKHHPFDFVLWKMAKPGEPSWESPWGLGRPGWHIECSAMSLENLGKTFDIHGGGPDLKFPHHENERAQSEAATGEKFVNYWMHVGYVQIEQEKMAKSLGNFITIREFLKNRHPEVLRYFSISSHYRSPVDYTAEHIESAHKALERFYIALRGIPLNFPVAAESAQSITNFPSSVAGGGCSLFEKRFMDAMNDDFNTPEAIAVLFDLVREINRLRDIDIQQAIPLAVLLKKLGNVLGLLYAAPETFLQHLKAGEMEPAEIEKLIEQRNQARKSKNWAEADRIRDLLLTEDIALEDTSNGTLWRRGGKES